VTKLHEAVSVEQFLQNDPEIIAGYAAAIAPSGATVADVDAAIVEWFNLLLTPLSLVFVVIFATVFRLVEPRYTFFGHVLFYVVAANASSIVALPLVAGLSLADAPAGVVSAASALLQLFYVCLMVWAFMRRTVLGGVIKVALVLAVGMIGGMLFGMAMWLAVNALAAERFGAGPVGFAVERVAENAAATPD
jgi:hypothetical protein